MADVNSFLAGIVYTCASVLMCIMQAIYNNPYPLNLFEEGITAVFPLASIETKTVVALKGSLLLF